MSTQQIKHSYRGTPFHIQAERIDHGAGYWSTWRVNVFRDYQCIGHYERTYSSYVKETFYPFQVDDVWYALYSANYTATRVAKLTDKFEDWCGEDSASNGFCPTEFYVPQYNTVGYGGGKGRTEFNIHTFDNEYSDKNPIDTEDEFFVSQRLAADFKGSKYLPYGFLCGCVWGDDSSWKLKHIDLSQIHNKQIKITSKFGYWELPNNLSLRECIKLMEPDHPWISITGQKAFHLPSGQDEDTYCDQEETINVAPSTEVNRAEPVSWIARVFKKGVDFFKGV